MSDAIEDAERVLAEAKAHKTDIENRAKRKMGGGGKGMFMIQCDRTLAETPEAARTEASARLIVAEEALKQARLNAAVGTATRIEPPAEIATPKQKGAGIGMFIMGVLQKLENQPGLGEAETEGEATALEHAHATGVVTSPQSGGQVEGSCSDSVAGTALTSLCRHRHPNQE